MRRDWTDERLEDFGRRLRLILGIETQLRPDLLTVIVKLKHLDPSFNYSRVADSEMPNVEAQWDSNRKIIRLRESTFCGMQAGDSRKRFVVAEEVMHYKLGHLGLLNRSTEKTIGERAVARVRFQEFEARRAAAAFLAPEYLAPERISPEGLANVFAISLESATYRVEEIDRVRRRRLGQLRPLPQFAEDLLRDAKRRGFNVRSIDD